MEWPDFGVILSADLMDSENPQLCDRFWQGLPFTTIFAASMSAGEMFKIPIPVILPRPQRDKFVLFAEEPPGTMVSLGTGSLLLKYGIVVEPFRLPRLAVIPPAELDKLRNVALKLRDAYFFTKEINVVTFRQKK